MRSMVTSMMSLRHHGVPLDRRRFGFQPRAFVTFFGLIALRDCSPALRQSMTFAVQLLDFPSGDHRLAWSEKTARGA